MINLRQGVHEVTQQLRPGMVPAVPGTVGGGIVQAKVGGEVDDQWCEAQESIRVGGGLAMGEAQKHHVRALHLLATDKRRVGAPAQMRMHRRQRLASKPLRTHLGELDLGVTKQEAEQFAAHISRTPDH